MTDQEYMQKALIEAKQAFEEGEVPVGAVIVCRDRIIARAHNLTERLTDVTAHSCSQRVRRKIPDRLHTLRHGRTLRYVCRSIGLGAVE